MNSSTDITSDPETGDLAAEVPRPREAVMASPDSEPRYAPALSGAWFARLPRYRFIAPLLAGKRVLEVQCGDGTGSAILAEAGTVEVVAIDERPDVVQAARARAGSRVECKLGRASDLEFDDDAFDAVVWLAPEWSADPQSLREVRRVLKAGGLFLCLWTNPEAFGLERLLPGAESRLLRDTSLVDACASLSEHFALVSAARQIPRLAFRFSSVEELPVPGVPDGAVEDASLAHAEPTADFAEAVFVCADDADDVDASGAPTVIAMPYFGVAESLGRALGHLYRNIEDLSQRNLMLEGQLEDQIALAVDLEEEVREQRALAADQAERLAHSGPLEVTGGDLAMRYARSQADLAQTQQGLIDLTAEFTRRVQELTWSLQERDQYIDHLVGTIRSWEEYANRTADELEARELALTNLGEVYRKCTEELDALRVEGDGDTHDVRGDGAVVRASLAQVRDPGLVAATITEMRRSYDVLAAECGDLRRQLAAAHIGRAEAERARLSAAADEAEQRTFVARVTDRLDRQQAESEEFAEGVQAVFEERNQLLREKIKLQAEVVEARGKVEQKHEANLDIEREMNRRTLRIAALERETMSKNIENTGLERENLRLLALKSDGDEEIVRLNERLLVLEAELAALRSLPEQTASAPDPPIDEPDTTWASDVVDVAHEVGEAPRAQVAADPGGAPPVSAAKVRKPRPRKTTPAPETPAATTPAAATPAAATPAATTPAAATPAPTTPAASTPAAATPAQELAMLTVAQLRARASAAGLTGYSKMRKDALVAALQTK